MIEASEFDGVILGDSSSGLWMAHQLISKGWKLLVIATGTSTMQNALPRVIAEDFGFNPMLDVRAHQPLQILTPNYRFRMFPSEAEFKREYQLQFGKKFSLSGQMDLEFLRGLAFWVRGAETGPVLADDLPGLYSRFFDTVYFDESPGFVTQTLLSRLEKSGATIVRPGSLRRIFIDRKAVVGVQLSNTSRMISVQRALVNTHLDYLNAFFSEPLPYSSRPLGWRFEIRFECSPEALPLGLTKRMIYVEGQAPILEIFQEKPGFFRLATTVPMHSYTLDRGEQRRLAARMLRVCETIIPDLEYNLKKVIPDLRDPDRSETVDLPALYPFQELKRIPSHILSFGSGAQSLPPNPMPGLWITHEEVNPKEAIWGAFEASRSALKAIEASFVNKTESAKL